MNETSKRMTEDNQIHGKRKNYSNYVKGYSLSMLLVSLAHWDAQVSPEGSFMREVLWQGTVGS